MCIRKLLPLTVCIILHLYHQDLSANAIVAERSMTHVSTDKVMHKWQFLKNYNKKEKKAQIEIYPSVW